MVHEILSLSDDYSLQRLRVCVHLLDLSTQVSIRIISAEELLKIDANAKSIILLTENGPIISTVNEILVFIASLSTTERATLFKGISTEHREEVEKTLSTSWKELEIPLQTILALQSGKPEFTLTPNDRIKVEQQAYEDIAKFLRMMDKKLSSKTFWISESLTLADVSLFFSLTASLPFGLLDKDLYPSVFRWFMTVGNMLSASGAYDFTPINEKFQSTLKVIEGSTGGKWSRHRTRVKELLSEGASAIGREVVLKGWVRTARSAEKGNVLFVELNDGSTSKSVQLVMTAGITMGMEAVAISGGVHASISAKGVVVPSPAKGQSIEITVSSTQVLGAVYGGEHGEIGGKNYPLSKKAHSLEYLREMAHLRPRSKVFSAALRVRNAMAFATHKFFNDRGFVYVHTPLITGADCEGAGEQFTVTTLINDDTQVKDIKADKKGHIDYSHDFFGKRCALTVSGQLNVETHACALSDVYTFGPTFRAENSHTTRHLAEFWMIEPEICFADLADDMALAEDYVRYCVAYALEHCADDIAYFEHEYPDGEKGLSDRLKNVVESDFARITYTEGVEILQRDVADNKVTFERYPEWGHDLGSEHERYLSEKIFERPTIVINYPKGIKAFYMKLNDDNETVAAMDILVPKIGELIGGSQREDRYDVLVKRCIESNLKPEDMWWYLDLRKYGSVPHAGFGLGFERLIMFVTGLKHIQDVIPFPRVPGKAEF